MYIIGFEAKKFVELAEKFGNKIAEEQAKRYCETGERRLSGECYPRSTTSRRATVRAYSSSCRLLEGHSIYMYN